MITLKEPLKKKEFDRRIQEYLLEKLRLEVETAQVQLETAIIQRDVAEGTDAFVKKQTGTPLIRMNRKPKPPDEPKEPPK